MALVAGSIFAEYTILKLLGSGGMGKVYLAQHPRLPRDDALKILRRSLSADDEYRERFQREADAAATLFHPNILGVHDRGEFRGRLWIAMDYVDGTDAKELMQQRFPAGMSARDVLAIVTAIADALDYAHRQGVIHRDVKPSNILMMGMDDSAPRVLLADFGIARQLNDPSGLTASHLTIGTIAYAAPEQLMGSEGLSRADQYALAATTFDLLTGTPPFPDDNPVTVISQHLNSPPPMLSDLRPELKQLDQVIATALAKDPADRFSNCCEFAAALAEHLAMSGADMAPGSVSTVIAADLRPSTDAPIGGSTGRFPRLSRSRMAKLALGSVAGATAVAGSVVLWPGVTDHRPEGATGATVGSETASTAAASPGGQLPGSSAIVPFALNGTYRVDANRADQKYNGVPNPQPPNISTWWAVRSWCAPDACTATGVMLDNTDHRVVADTPTPGNRLILDFAGNSWRSRPEIVQFACTSADGTQGTQATTQVLSLQPTIEGVLHGEMVVTVDSDECGQRGAQIQVPVVATRLGDVPRDVNVPDLAGAPETSAPAAPVR